jgi:hypothetical protein
VTDRPLTSALLLADTSPCLRSLVLTELLGRSRRDLEVRELEAARERDPATVLAAQSDGAPPGVSPAVAAGVALARLGYLGFGRSHPAVERLSAELYARQQKDGSWPLPRASDSRGGYDAIPLQTAIPLRGLAMCGCAEDPRAEKAYEWLETMRLEDGAWPTGLAQGVHGRVGGYRRLPHSRWGCRSNTTGVLLCLAHHPSRRAGEHARRALDHLLARETRDRSALGVEVARVVGASRARGFITFYAAFDAALVLDLSWRIGASREDERVQGLVDFVLRLRGPEGLWECRHAPAASRWLTFDLSRSLSRLAGESAWMTVEPRTPYASYPRKPRRN